MSGMIKHINIIPVFNQAPLFRSTFVGIQTQAMLGNYNYHTVPDEVNFEISQLYSAWRRFKSHFAFVARDGDKMVGCINGIIVDGVATIKGLYVLPAYQKMRTGARLLAAAERAASIHTDKMELFAVDRAETFYESHKYTLVSKTGMHGKSIRGAARDTVVPIFWCRPEMKAQCQLLAAHCDLEFSADDVNVHHAPMFAYIDGDDRIGGYILGYIPDNMNSDVRVHQLCSAPDAAGNGVARRLIESMAQMNIR